VTRRPDPAHLAFGFGEHFCLGNNLARREIKIVLAELLRRFPNYEVIGPYTRTVQHMTPGIKSLPVSALSAVGSRTSNVVCRRENQTAPEPTTTV
jgi:cytochrome P450